METVPTIADIVAHTLALKPAVAAGFPGGQSEALCTTMLYRQVRLDDGMVAELKLRNGKHGAGYPRVSSISQRTANDKGEGDGRDGEDALKDGWSEQDQVQRIINYFVTRREAFRIYSDCGLGGYLPYNDERLKEKMLRAKARRYEKMFTNIFLSDLMVQKYTPAQREALREYLAGKRKMILDGLRDEEFEADDVAEAEIVKVGTTKGSRRGRMTVTFRPGLTFFVRDMSKIHTLALTDLSRLSRSQTLSAEIGEKILEHKIGVQGLVEDLGWMSNDEEIGNQMMAFFIPKFAEYRLGEVLMNAMRGIVTMLASGRPFGQVPKWIQKDQDGRAHHHPEKVKAIQQMIEFFMTEDVLSSRKVALMLAEQHLAPPAGKTWHRSTVINTLQSPALLGKQHFFGLEWQVWEPLVTEVEYARIQGKLERLQEVYPNYAPKDGRNMAAYLLKCPCGSSISFRRTSRGVEQMRCSAPATKKKQNPGFQHVTLSWANVKKFIDEFMMEHPRVVLDAYKDSQERTALVDELQRAERGLHQTRQRLAEREATSREQARDNVLKMGIDEKNPEFEATLRQVLTALMTDLTGEVRHLEDKIKETRYRLDTLVPQDVMTSLEQRVAAWESLDARQQNEILLAFFKEWRVEGTPPNEVIVPVLRNLNEDALFPIRLKTTGKVHPIRRLPSVDEYFESLQEGIVL